MLILHSSYTALHRHPYRKPVTPAPRSRLRRPPALCGRFWRRAGCYPSPPFPRPVRGLWRRAGRSGRPGYGGCGRWRWSLRSCSFCSWISRFFLLVSCRISSSMPAIFSALVFAICQTLLSMFTPFPRRLSLSSACLGMWPCCHG